MLTGCYRVIGYRFISWPWGPQVMSHWVIWWPPEGLTLATMRASPSPPMSLKPQGPPPCIVKLCREPAILDPRKFQVLAVENRTALTPAFPHCKSIPGILHVVANPQLDGQRSGRICMAKVDVRVRVEGFGWGGVGCRWRPEIPGSWGRAPVPRYLHQPGDYPVPRVGQHSWGWNLECKIHPR